MGTPVRLQRYLATAGVAARRKAEELIVAGRVKVNGQVITVLGSKVDPDNDSVEVDNEAVAALDHFYVLFNKPKACITAVTDDRGRPTVMDYLPNLPVPVKPVGRLDFYSEGVLLLTNDGELAARLLAPANHVPKTYHVKVRGRLERRHLEALRDGVTLDDGVTTLPAEVEVLPGESKHTWLGITIHEGKHRQIHRMIEALGYQVDKLQRVAFASLTFHNLRIGDARELSQLELNELRDAVGLDHSAVARGRWHSNREDTDIPRRARAKDRAEAEAEAALHDTAPDAELHQRDDAWDEDDATGIDHGDDGRSRGDDSRRGGQDSGPGDERVARSGPQRPAAGSHHDRRDGAPRSGGEQRDFNLRSARPERREGASRGGFGDRGRGVPARAGGTRAGGGDARGPAGRRDYAARFSAERSAGAARRRDGRPGVGDGGSGGERGGDPGRGPGARPDSGDARGPGRRGDDAAPLGGERGSGERSGGPGRLGDARGGHGDARVTMGRRDRAGSIGGVGGVGGARAGRGDARGPAGRRDGAARFGSERGGGVGGARAGGGDARGPAGRRDGAARFGSERGGRVSGARAGGGDARGPAGRRDGAARFGGERGGGAGRAAGARAGGGDARGAARRRDGAARFGGDRGAGSGRASGRSAGVVERRNSSGRSAGTERAERPPQRRAGAAMGSGAVRSSEGGGGERKGQGRSFGKRAPKRGVR